MRNTFINTITELARHDERIIILTADMGFSVFEKFRAEFPERFFNIGIAEQNAVGIGSGLALSGKIVYIYSIIPFITMRCFEQIRVDVAYSNTNVRLVGVGAGFSYGPAGATHQAIEDIAIMRTLPNMTVCCPGDPVEVESIIKQSVDHRGPLYIRLGKNGEPKIHSDNLTFKIGQAIKLCDGNDFALITTSNMLGQAKIWVDEWREKGIMVALVSMPTVKPIDQDIIKELVDCGIPIVCLEEHSIIGGLGSAVAELLAEGDKKVRFKRIGIEDQYSHYVGSQNYLRNQFGLTKEKIENWFKFNNLEGKI